MTRLFRITILLITGIALYLPISSKAQYLEYGANAFGTMYFGDLTHVHSFLYSTRSGAGVHFRRHLTKSLSLRADVNLAMLAGSDNTPYVKNQTSQGKYTEFFKLNDSLGKVFSHRPDVVLRNLSFRSVLREFNFVLEYKLGEVMINSNTPRFNYYLFSGFNVYAFDPEARSDSADGAWFRLKGFSTEGQGMPNFYPGVEDYKTTQIGIPLGIGIRWTLDKYTRVAAEIGYRFIFTDYLDDVSGKYVVPSVVASVKGQRAAEFIDRSSQLHPYLKDYYKLGDSRGNPGNDGYLFFGFSVSKVIYPNLCPKL